MSNLSDILRGEMELWRIIDLLGVSYAFEPHIADQYIMRRSGLGRINFDSTLFSFFKRASGLALNPLFAAMRSELVWYFSCISETLTMCVDEID